MKTLLMSVLALFLAIPAFAQGHRGNGGGHEQRGHEQQRQQRSTPPHSVDRPARERHDNDNRRWERDDRGRRGNEDREFHEREGWGHDRRGYHYGAPQHEIREHWNGRRFDHDYFEDHWGERHRFYWNHCGWYGPRFVVGSYFWYGGVYFVVGEPVPAYWYADPVYVVYDDFCGCYYVVDPLYPGVRIHVDIRF